MIGLTATFFVDQLIKAWVRSAVAPGRSIELARYLRVTHVRNTGAAFGLFQGGAGALVMVTAAVLVLALAFWDRDGRQPAIIGFGAAVAAGGALGNLLDRLLLGCVVDFIDVVVWPVFNLADVAIVAGVACVFGGLVFQSKREGTK